MLARSSVDDAVDLLRCREHVAPTDQLPRLSLPTLLANGDRDRIVPLQGSRDLSERLGRAERRALPGLGHVPIVTTPAEVAALIDDSGKRGSPHALSNAPSASPTAPTTPGDRQGPSRTRTLAKAIRPVRQAARSGRF